MSAKLFKGIKHNLLAIISLLATVFFIISSSLLYNNYIHTDLTKEIFLNFSILIVLGLVSLSALFIFCNHPIKKFSKVTSNLVRVGLFGTAIIAFTFAGLMTTLVTDQIVRFFNFLLARIKSLKLPLNIYFLLSMNRSSSLLDEGNIGLGLVKVLSFVSSGLVMIFTAKVLLTTTSIFTPKDEQLTVSIVEGLTYTTPSQNSSCERLKRRLSFGYIYKAIP